MNEPLHAVDHRFLPRPGQMDALVDALRAAAALLARQPGLAGSEIFVDREHDACYFVEKWASREAWADAQASLPDDLLAPAIALARETPRATGLLCYHLA